jgi:hypothetical protein
MKNYQDFWNEAEKQIDLVVGNDDALRYAIKIYANKTIIKYLFFNTEYASGYGERQSEALQVEKQLTHSFSKYIVLHYDKEEWQEVAGEINAEAEAELKKLEEEYEKREKRANMERAVRGFYSDINKHAQELMLNENYTKMWGNCFADKKGIVRYIYKQCDDKCYKITYEATDNPSYYLVVASNLDSDEIIEAGIIKNDFSNYKIFQNQGGYFLEGIKQNRFAALIPSF